MTSKIWARPPSAGDVLHVARNMREMDAREILDIHKNLNRDLFAAVVSTRAAAPECRLALGFGLDGNPICAVVLLICASESTPWLGEASLFATDDFPRLAGQITRFIRRAVIPSLIAGGMRRVEARALASYAQTRCFLKHCGAVEEAILPDHGPESPDYVLCAWRRSDFVKGTEPCASAKSSQGRP